MKKPEQYYVDECDPRVVEYIQQLESERQQLIEALVYSKKAIESLPNDALGIAELSQGIVWYNRDELLDQIKTALRDVGVEE